MKRTQAVDVIIDITTPPGGLFSNETMTRPTWSTAEVSKTFFGRDDHVWIHKQVQIKTLYFDGEPLVISRSPTSDKRQWRLYDVERFAHALTSIGAIEAGQLVRVIEQVRIIAESWDHLPHTPVPIREADHEPSRKDIYVVKMKPEILDDLDGSPGAKHRHYSIGDVSYQIDLNDEHWQDLISALAPFTKVSRQGNAKNVPLTAGGRVAIRKWAKKNGYPISTYGPIPRATLSAYLMRGGNA